MKARTAVRVLFGLAAAILVANFLIYFGYALSMPTSPDFEAGRTVRVQLGGQQWVYVNAFEARLHEIVQKWLFVVLMGCVLVALWLSRRLGGDR